MSHHPISSTPQPLSEGGKWYPYTCRSHNLPWYSFKTHFKDKGDNTHILPLHHYEILKTDKVWARLINGPFYVLLKYFSEGSSQNMAEAK